ncbi:MAG: nucleotide pyrophosphohydrolase [bacterium]|nr:nucleotide pyrophosphohydrolase [bacterium]
MSDFKKLTDQIIKFREERNWTPFHNPKDCALSLTLEAAELLEHFQWKNGEQVEKYIKENKAEIADELIDVLWWVLMIASDLDIDIEKSFDRKIKKNAVKYPADKVRGKADKYTAYNK